MQSALGGLFPLFLLVFAAGSRSPQAGTGQGAETLAFCLQPAFGVGQSSLDASALQCLCRAGLGSGVRRKQEAKHPTPSPSPHQVEVRLHRAAYRAAGAWGIQPLVTASPGTQLPAPGTVLKSRADVPVLAPSPGASILLHPTALQVPPQLCVLGHPEEAVRLSWEEVHSGQTMQWPAGPPCVMYWRQDLRWQWG